MTSAHDPDGTRLPIKLDSTSNGEYCPIPLDPLSQHANRDALEKIDHYARRSGMTRRDFLVSASGAAATLLSFNQVRAASGITGGYFDLSIDTAEDQAAAAEALHKSEFIFDVQGHYVRPGGAETLKAGCSAAHEAYQSGYMECIGADQFIQDVFLDADTDLMVLSFVPSARDDEPLSIEEAAATRDIVDQLEGSQRLLIHGRVNPNQPGDIEDMPMLAERWGVSAWKCYTQWGPDGRGFFLTDDIGQRFIEQARALDVRNIAIHKGIPFGSNSYEHSLCSDIGPIARANPDINFLIYHSGWIPGQAEGPYNPDRHEGVDGLIESVLAHQVAGQNVYAELGSTWRGLMRDPDSAAHTIGKLVKYLGEDNILWGTDSVWYGSPQDQILAFRRFQISEEFQEKFGYAPITDSLRAKIFGLNATRPYQISATEIQQFVAHDTLSRQRQNYLQEPDPHFLTYGPKSRREFLNLLRLTGDHPS